MARGIRNPLGLVLVCIFFQVLFGVFNQYVSFDNSCAIHECASGLES